VGVCFEDSVRTSTDLESAMGICGSAGRRLPSPGELSAYSGSHTIQNGEQTDTLFINGSTRESVIVSPSGLGFNLSTTDNLPYRCVALPSN